MQRVNFEDLAVSAIIYGQPGAGKTRTAYTAIEDERYGNVLGLNLFGNPGSIKNYKAKGEFDLYTIETFDEMIGVLKWLVDGQKKGGVISVDYTYDTLIIDGYTEFNSLLLERVTGRRPEIGSLPPTQTIQQWGMARSMMVQISSGIIGLKNSGINVILTCLETTDESGVFVPLLAPKTVYETICSYPDVVMRVTQNARVTKGDIVGTNVKIDDLKGGDIETVGILSSAARSYAKCQVASVTEPIIKGPKMGIFKD